MVKEGKGKILIVSASVGSGHNQAAKAVAASFGKLYTDCECEIVDFMDQESSYLNYFVKQTYLNMLDISPALYDLLYRWSKPNREYLKTQNLVSRVLKRSMARLYDKHQPEFIVFTHPFPCGAAAFLRRTGKINVPLAAIITDFSVHQLWVYEEIDLYFVAGRQMRDELVRRGISPRRIHILGIPIDESFAERPEKVTLIEAQEPDGNLPGVLIMAGGFGVGPVVDVLGCLEDCGIKLQVTVVAGNNTALFRELSRAARFSAHKVNVLGFTEHIRDLMAGADILVTKPGALTVSEALAMALPTVLYSPLPGQEEDNACYLVARGAAELAVSNDALVHIVTKLLLNPARRKQMSMKAARLGKPLAAIDIAKKIYEYGLFGKKAAGL